MHGHMNVRKRKLMLKHTHTHTHTQNTPQTHTDAHAKEFREVFPRTAHFRPMHQYKWYGGKDGYK
jgi:hypothetical protein